MVKYEEKNNSFALRLKQHRELCRLTQQQVADILNINRTTYTKYETGVSEPSHEVLRKIVSIFGTDFNTILGDESPFKKTVVQDPDLQLYNLSDEEKMLAALKDSAEEHITALSQKSGVPVFKARAVLSSLEVKGLVVALGGNRYAPV